MIEFDKKSSKTKNVSSQKRKKKKIKRAFQAEPEAHNELKMYK